MKRILPFIFFPVSAFAQNPVVPVLNALIPDVENDSDDAQRSMLLADYFVTEEVKDNAVRLTAEWTLINGSPGTTNFDFLLFRNSTPVTTTNFLGYVNRGDCQNMVVHRLVKNFVIQGGGFTFTDGATGPVYDIVPTQPAIVNELKSTPSYMRLPCGWIAISVAIPRKQTPTKRGYHTTRLFIWSLIHLAGVRFMATCL